MKRWTGLLVMAGSVIVVVVAFLLVLQLWGDQIGVNTQPSDEYGAQSSSADEQQPDTSVPGESGTDRLNDTTAADQQGTTTDFAEGSTEESTESTTATEDPTEAQTQVQGNHDLWQVLTMTEEEALARGKVIYLTFDDGPSEHTPKLLDILDKYNVKATFFVTGTDTNCFDYIGKAADRGHSIGIHCYSHWYEKIYSSDEAYLEDMKKMDDIIFEQTGLRTKLMRFPGGGSNQVSMKYNMGIMTRLSEYVESHGYHFFDWNVDSQDAAGVKDKDKVVENIITSIQMRPVSVVLQHDIYDYSVEAAEEVIRWGLQNGYVFLPLSEISPVFHHGIVN